MWAAFHQPSVHGLGARVRRRTPALVLVAAAHVLLIILLLQLAPPTPPSTPAVTTFELLPALQERTPRTVKPQRAATEHRAHRPRAQPVPPPAPVPPVELDMIPLTPEEFAASDIAKLPAPSYAAPSSDAAHDAASADAAGSGPNGEQLYHAEWYREPTRAELAYYLPANAPRIGWAVIACQTVTDRRVDNCIEIDQSPAGSGLAAAIRQAAWQFRVWPPRIGGRPLVGAWVRIRIDFTEVPAK